MPPRRKSALEELIRTGLVADGELLRYKSKQGQVLAIGRAREGGIEVDGVNKLLGYTAFEDIAGSRYHRPAEHTHSMASRNLQGLGLMGAGGADGGGGRGGRQAAPEPAAPAVNLMEDESDDLCYICGLGGDLVCCETCPAVFHAACVGLPGAPADDFYCPACRCTVCGGGGYDGVMPTGCHWVDCQHFAGLASLQQHSRPHVGPPSSGSSAAGAPGAPAKQEPAIKAEPSGGAAEAAAEMSGAAGSGEGVAGAAAGAPQAGSMQVDAMKEEPSTAAGLEGLVADFGPLIAAATAEWRSAEPPSGVAEAAAAARATAAAAAPDAAVPCPVTLQWAHLRCFPPEFAAQLRQSAPQPCISSMEAVTTSTRLAAASAAGAIPLGSIAEGARAGAGGGSGGVDARAPLPLSLLVVRGAAAAAPGDCRGHAPAYSAEQREQIRGALSAALRVLHSCYEAVPDSRTGADILPWLLRGAVLARGEVDYSGVHTALLYAGPAVVAAAVFRSFGVIAELPVLAVRPELQRRNGLGRLLLAAVEQLLLHSGAQWLLTPAFTADGQPYLPAMLPPPALDGTSLQQQQPGAAPAGPALLQSKWGYSLAPADVALATSKHPLVRLPGVLLACKQLSAESVLPPPRLPDRLQWSGTISDARQLVKEGMLASVAAAPGAAAAVATAAAAAAAAARAAPTTRPKPGRPPKAPAPAAPAAAAAAALKQEQQQHAWQQPSAAEQQQQQQYLAMMYQQQVLAQQAAAMQQQTGQPPSQEQMLALYQQQQQILAHQAAAQQQQAGQPPSQQQYLAMLYQQQLMAQQQAQQQHPHQ